VPSRQRPFRSEAPPPAAYIGSSSSSLSVSLSRSSVPHIGRAGAGVMGDGVIGGRPGVSVPSVVCSVEGFAGAARRLRVAVPLDDVRFVRAAVRRAPERPRADRADVRRFAVFPRLRVVARLLREPVLARFFRRVLLAIVGSPPCPDGTLSHRTGGADVRAPSTGLGLFLSERSPLRAAAHVWLRRRAGHDGACSTRAGCGRSLGGCGEPQSRIVDGAAFAPRDLFVAALHHSIGRGRGCGAVFGFL
jgi:hypothetical protein